jgi:Flp pilus assembly protein TadG
MKALWQDEEGFALVYGTLVITLLLGFAILAVDVSRVESHQTQLQKAADAAAMAAAAELDGKADSLERAVRAINNIASGSFQNRSVFGTVAAATIPVSPDLDVRFFERLPVDGNPGNSTGTGDNMAITTGGNAPTADPVKAAFAEVRVRREEQGSFLNTVLPLGVLGASSNTVGSAAVAVAGNDGDAWCEPTPMFICNPYESAPGNGSSQLQLAIQNGDLRRRLLMLRQVGGNEAQYFPGNFGLIQPPNGGNGANAILDLLARNASGICIRQRGVELKTGNLDPVRSAINVRFDIYDQMFNNKRNDPNYSPAPNVRKGYSYNGANACGATPHDPPDVYSQPPAATTPNLASVRPYQPMPLDDCFYTNSCPTGPFSALMAGRIGDGQWNFDTYWAVNHPGTPPPNGWSNANRPSRYEVYLYELGNLAVLNERSLGVGGNPARGEVGAPQCSTNPGDAKRRIIHAVVLNCLELDADPNYGPLNGASSDQLPAEGLAQFFIIQPILPQNYKGDADSAKKLYVEFIDIVRPSAVTQTIVHPIVRLYR